MSRASRFLAAKDVGVSVNLHLYAAPWCKPQMTDEVIEAISIFGSNLWADASVRFYAERDARISAGLRAPKGMQATLNSLINERFMAKDWRGDSGYFFKGKTWLRVTFRHQMSLGSDIVDAIKVCKKEDMEIAVIVAADKETLKLISPNDAGAIVSFEKLQSEVANLDGALDIPLLIGRLTPASQASKIIDDEIRKSRPRDITVPIIPE